MNSKKINEKLQKIEIYEKELKNRGIYYSYPDLDVHLDVPKLGKTKGNGK